MISKLYAGFLNTPPLWINAQFGIAQFKFPQVDLVDFTAQPIPTKIRLGHQMEHVLKQLLAHSRQFDLLIHNLTVKNKKTTLGEVDFILRNRETDRLIHVELTYKFYIIHPEISAPVHRLMGPNKRDMFFTKMEKIRTEQFPLLHSEYGKAALHENNVDHSKLEHQACFKAQLFVHYGLTYTNIRPLNKACIQGYWLHFDDFNTQDFQPYCYYIPFKWEWVVAPHNNVPWQSHFETLMEINLRMIKENAPMIWIKKSAHELEKCFVVWW